MRLLLRDVWLGLLRDKAVNALLIATMAFGIAIAVFGYAANDAFQRSPLDDRAAQSLHLVELLDDQVLAARNANEELQWTLDYLNRHMAYRDALALLHSPYPSQQTAILHARTQVNDLQRTVRFCNRDFFTLFEGHFAHGDRWSLPAEQQRRHESVISLAASRRLFGVDNSVGRMLRIEGVPFRVVGVLQTVKGGRLIDAYAKQVQVYLPLGAIHDLVARPFVFGPRGSLEQPRAQLLASDSRLASVWVSLPRADQRVAYRRWVDNYLHHQQSTQRQAPPRRARIRCLALAQRALLPIPTAARSAPIIGLIVLLATMLTATRLLLARFFADAQLVGIRRAIGATRGRVFWQHLLEAETVGIIGGLLGTVVAAVGLPLLNVAMPSLEVRMTMNLQTLGVAVAAALASGVLAGLYPAWQASRQPPAALLGPVR